MLDGPGLDVTIRDLIVEGTHPREDCQRFNCYGHALRMIDNTELDLSRFRFSSNQGCGFLFGVLEEGTIDITDGEITGNTYGACFNSEINPRELLERIYYHDNGGTFFREDGS